MSDHLLYACLLFLWIKLYPQLSLLRFSQHTAEYFIYCKWTSIVSLKGESLDTDMSEYTKAADTVSCIPLSQMDCSNVSLSFSRTSALQFSYSIPL